MLGHSRHEAGKVEDIVQQAFDQSIEPISCILLHGGLEYYLWSLHVTYVYIYVQDNNLAAFYLSISHSAWSWL